MQIQQFRFSSDNLGYVLHSEGQAVAVDGGAVEEILAYLARRKLTLKYLLYTHEHPDHTVGRARLLEQTGATHLTYDQLTANPALTVGNATLQVLTTPGHTSDSLCFYTGSGLISGDTLFNGTVGNCFSGDLKGFHTSIKRLMALPEDTLVYAGHDYVDYAMKFARLVEPENSDIDRFLEKYNSARVVSTLADELAVNPYLRFNASGMLRVLQQRGLPVGTEYERWESVMKLE